jgi:hypothetical protein
MEKTTYVQFMQFGYPSDIGERRRVDRREITAVDVPPGAYGFYFYDKFTMTGEVNGKAVDFQSVGETNPSPMTYVKGTVYTQEEFRAMCRKSNLDADSIRARWNVPKNAKRVIVIRPEPDEPQFVVFPFEDDDQRIGA